MLWLQVIKVDDSILLKQMFLCITYIFHNWQNPTLIYTDFRQFYFLKKEALEYFLKFIREYFRHGGRIKHCCFIYIFMVFSWLAIAYTQKLATLPCYSFEETTTIRYGKSWLVVAQLDYHP